MKIKRFEQEVKLDILPFGTCFTCAGLAYIQCEQHKFRESNYIYAVRLSDGFITAFEKSTTVVPYKEAEVLLK